MPQRPPAPEVEPRVVRDRARVEIGFLELVPTSLIRAGPFA